MIKKGSIVTIYFSTAPILKNVKVLHLPSESGDMWTLVNNFGKEHKVMNFDRMDECD